MVQHDTNTCIRRSASDADSFEVLLLMVLLQLLFALAPHPVPSILYMVGEQLTVFQEFLVAQMAAVRERAWGWSASPSPASVKSNVSLSASGAETETQTGEGAAASSIGINVKAKEKSSAPARSRRRSGAKSG